MRALIAGILKYFEPQHIRELPDPKGPLAACIPTNAIRFANNEVAKAQQKQPWGRYYRVIPYIYIYKHSLTRKLVGYRNWRQLWYKKLNVTEAKYRMLSHYPFLKTLFPSFYHHHCLKFLYPTNFLVRECFCVYLQCNIVHEYRIFLFQKPCSLPFYFYTTFASNSYILPTFLLENVFFTCVLYFFKCWQVPPPLPRFNYLHEQTLTFVWDNCKERDRILTRCLVVFSSPLLFAQF